MKTIEPCFVCASPVIVVRMMDRTKFYDTCNNCGHVEAGLMLGEAPLSVSF